MEPRHARRGPLLSERLPGEQPVADKHALLGHRAEDRFRQRPAGGIVDDVSTRGDGANPLRVMLRDGNDTHRLQPFSVNGERWIRTRLPLLPDVPTAPAEWRNPTRQPSAAPAFLQADSG
jgi:hypothetical protein